MIDVQKWSIGSSAQPGLSAQRPASRDSHAFNSERSATIPLMLR